MNKREEAYKQQERTRKRANKILQVEGQTTLDQNTKEEKPWHTKKQNK